MTNDKDWQRRSDEWVKAIEKSRKEKEKKAENRIKKDLRSPSNDSDSTVAISSASELPTTVNLKNGKKSKQ